MEDNEIYSYVIEFINGGELESIEDAIDEYPDEILGEYADCVTEMLGMGGLGFALLCKDKINVVKLTVDKTEYNFAINAHRFKNYNSVFVNIHSVAKLAENEMNQTLSLIHKEYAVALNKTERSYFSIFNELNHIGNEMHDKLDYHFGLIARKNHPNLGVMNFYHMVNEEKEKTDYRGVFQMLVDGKYPTNKADKIIYNSMRDYIDWFNDHRLSEIRNEKILRFSEGVHKLAKEDGIFFYDFKAENIGKRNDEDGEYCVFDFGHIIF